jgi:HEAT repeat protein
VLGGIGDPAAVEPLIRVLLDPTKGTKEFTTVQNTALLALVKIGKPAADAAGKLLRSDYESMQTFQLRRIREVTGSDEKGRPWVNTGALILGAIGRQDSIPVMVEAIKAESDASTKAFIAREIANMPATPESIEAFQETFLGTPLDTLVQGAGAIDLLTDAAARFADASFASWLLEAATKLKGDAEDRKAAQAAITVAAMKLVKPDGLADVRAAVNKYGSELEKGAFKQVEAVLGKCKEDVDCFLGVLKDPNTQKRENQFAGIKAGYMLAILGDEQTPAKIVQALDSITNAGLRHVAAQAIDKLSPKGSKTIADKLDAIITTNAKSPDRDKAAGDTSLKQVMYRLNARSG